MKSRLQIAFISWRFYAVVIFILILVIGLIARMIDLTVIKRHFLQTQGNSRAIRIENSPAFRGMITDRNGYPLAISTSVFSIWANPAEVVKDLSQIKALSQLLGTEPKKNKISYPKLCRQKTGICLLKTRCSPRDCPKDKIAKNSRYLSSTGLQTLLSRR